MCAGRAPISQYKNVTYVKLPVEKTKIILSVQNINNAKTLENYITNLVEGVDKKLDQIKEERKLDKLGISFSCHWMTCKDGTDTFIISYDAPQVFIKDFCDYLSTHFNHSDFISKKNDKLSVAIDQFKKQLEYSQNISIADRVNKILYGSQFPEAFVPLYKNKIKYLTNFETHVDRALVQNIKKGTFHAIIIGDLDEKVIKDFADWGDKTFSGKEELPEPGVRKFDGKVHFFENKTLGSMHNTVMVLPMVNVNSPYYGHSLILKEILLPTLSQGMGGVLSNTLRFGAKPLYNVQSGWDRDLSLFFQCPDRETPLHIKALKDAMSLLLTQGVSEQQFMKAKQQAKAFVDYFKTDPNLLIQFINMLREVTLSIDEMNGIISSIEATLDTITCEQFNATLKEFYSPQQATYFYEGVVNTANGRRE